MKRSIILFIVLTFGHICSAQDSTDVLDQTTTAVKKTRFVFSFDSRWSRVQGETVRITGLKIGWERFEKNRYGFGFYGLRDPIDLGKNRGQIYKETSIPTEDVELQSELTYFVFFWDHLFINEKKVEVSLNSEFGPATAQLQFLDYTNLDDLGFPTIEVLDEVEFAFVELGVTGHYKILPWIGPGAGFGYRLALSNDNNIRRVFSGPVGILKVKIFLGPIYRGIFPKKEKNKSK